MNGRDVVLGVDAGGSKTIAWVAAAEPDGSGDTDLAPLGEGDAGPGNALAAGWDAARDNLSAAVRAALGRAGREPSDVVRTCVGAAGSDNDEIRDHLRGWAAGLGLGGDVLIRHDGWLVLAAGTPGCVGVALIAGTGSLGFGRNAAGATARAGGWGPLLGDEGSGYALGRAALRATVRAADGRGEPTTLGPAVMEALGVDAAAALIPRAYRPPLSPKQVAALAPLVLSHADAVDAVALGIVDRAAADLALHVAALAGRLGMGGGPIALALGGGVLCHGERLRDRLLAHVRTTHCLNVATATLVPHPVRGAVALARTGAP